MKPLAKFTFGLLTFMVLFTYCKTDSVEIPTFDCEKKDLLNGYSQPLYSPVLPFFWHLSVNPNDSRVIAFKTTTVDNALEQVHGVYTYNLESEELDFITTGRINGPLDWSKNGTFVFQEYTGNGNHSIITMDEDGSNRNQITPSGIFTFPTWDPTGTKIWYSEGYTEPTKIYITTPHNEILDTFRSIYHEYLPNWGTESHVSVGHFGGLNLFDLDNDTVHVLHDIPLDEIYSWGAHGSTWLNDEDIIWTTPNGIFETNIHDRITDTILRTCPYDLYYESPVYSEAIERLVLVERVHDENEELGKYTTQTIVSMNLDGSDIRHLEIPIE